jgi:hypothetical protein
LSENGSRPAHLEEFARKLAAAVAEQGDAGKTRFRPVRSPVNVEVPSSRSADEGIAPGSTSNYQSTAVERPSSETHKTWTRSSSPESKTESPQCDSAHEPAKASARATGGVYATQPAAPLSNLTDISSAGRAVKSPTWPAGSAGARIGMSDKFTRAAANQASPAVAQAFPRGSGNWPGEEIEAAPECGDSKPRYTVDLEKLLADTEALPSNDAEVAQVVAANLRARPLTEAIERFSGSWKQIASAGVLVILAVAGATTLAQNLLAVPKAPSRAQEPMASETIIRDDSAQEAARARALEPSSAVEDRLGDSSGTIGATVSVPPANETPEAGGNQATNRPPGSTPEASDPTRLTSSLAPAIQLPNLNPAPADSTPAAAPSNDSAVQTSDLKSAATDPTTSATSSPAALAQPPSGSRPAATVSPQPTPTSRSFPTVRPAAADAGQRSAKVERNVGEVGGAKLLPTGRDVPAKVVGKPLIGTTVTKNTAKPSQPSPVGPPGQPEEAIAPGSAQSPSPPSVDSDASGREPPRRPTYAIGRGGTEAQYPTADLSSQRPLLRAIGDMFGKGTAPAQRSADTINPPPRAE